VQTISALRARPLGAVATARPVNGRVALGADANVARSGEARVIAHRMLLIARRQQPIVDPVVAMPANLRRESDASDVMR
jgi:hypothetical protein